MRPRFANACKESTTEIVYMPAVDTLFEITAFIAISIVAVLAHEYGHALAAVRNGGKVKSLNVGFGPVLFSRALSVGQLNTELRIRVFFFGGYVVLDESSLDNLGVPQRVVILLGGVLMNLILAVLAFLWISINPGKTTPLEYVVRDLPPRTVNGDLVAPMDSTYVLSSLKETIDRTEWRFESGDSSAQTAHTKTLKAPCSPDCDAVLARVFGIELSKAFRRTGNADPAGEKVIWLSVDGRRFSSVEALEEYLQHASRNESKLAIEAVCGTRRCKLEEMSSKFVGGNWESVAKRDVVVVSDSWALVTLPLVVTKEIIRSTYEGGKLVYDALFGVRNAGPHYEGALSRLGDFYKAQGVLFEGWVSLAFAFNIGLVAINCLPFYGSDGYRVLVIILEGPSRWRRVFTRVLLVLSVGWATFFLLGVMGAQVAVWTWLVSLVG